MSGKKLLEEVGTADDDDYDEEDFDEYDDDFDEGDGGDVTPSHDATMAAAEEVLRRVKDRRSSEGGGNEDGGGDGGRDSYDAREGSEAAKENTNPPRAASHRSGSSPKKETARSDAAKSHTSGLREPSATPSQTSADSTVFIYRSRRGAELTGQKHSAGAMGMHEAATKDAILAAAARKPGERAGAPGAPGDGSKKSKMRKDRMLELSKPRDLPPELKVCDGETHAWIRRNLRCTCKDKSKRVWCTATAPQPGCARARQVHARVEDSRQCKFRPKLNKKSLEMFAAATGNAEQNCLIRMAAKERARRQAHEDARGMEVYNAKTDKLVCPECGSEQSYQEWKEGIKRCSKEGCGKYLYKPRIQWGSIEKGFMSRLKETQKAKEARLQKQREEMYAFVGRGFKANPIPKTSLPGAQSVRRRPFSAGQVPVLKKR